MSILFRPIDSLALCFESADCVIRVVLDHIVVEGSQILSHSRELTGQCLKLAKSSHPPAAMYLFIHLASIWPAR